MTDLVNYQVDGAIAASLDAITTPKTAILYWWEGKLRYTNRKHLQRFVTLGLYSYDAESIMSNLASLKVNQTAQEDYEKPENLLGIPLKITSLSDVNIQDAQNGDILTFENGKVVNKIQAHKCFDRSSEYWSTWTDSGWDKVPGLSTKSCSKEIDDYELILSMTCSSSSNSRYVKVGFFVNNQEQEHLTDQYYFRDKQETMCISLTDRIYEVPPGATIDVRVKRGSGSGTTFRTTRRSLTANEILNSH